jgi:hypothetical protein
MIYLESATSYRQNLHIIIINDYRPCCNIGKNILKDTLNDGKLRESATKSHAPISNQSAETSFLWGF